MSFDAVEKYNTRLLIYTCQLFLRYKREIFILGVLGFLQTTRSFSKIPEEVRSLPKTSEVCRRRSYRENAYPQNQRSRGGYCYLFIYTWFSFLTLVWVNTFLEIVSSKTATTHIFQSGVRNWPAGVSRREIEVFNPQAWDSRLRRESWQVYWETAFTSGRRAQNASSEWNGQKRNIIVNLWQMYATG